MRVGGRRTGSPATPGQRGRGPSHCPPQTATPEIVKGVQFWYFVNSIKSLNNNYYSKSVNIQYSILHFSFRRLYFKTRHNI